MPDREDWPGEMPKYSSIYYPQFVTQAEMNLKSVILAGDLLLIARI